MVNHMKHTIRNLYVGNDNLGITIDFIIGNVIIVHFLLTSQTAVLQRGSSKCTAIPGEIGNFVSIGRTIVNDTVQGNLFLLLHGQSIYGGCFTIGYAFNITTDSIIARCENSIVATG